MPLSSVTLDRMTTDLSPTPRSTIQRSKNRAVTDRAALYDVLDAGLVCHLGFVVAPGGNGSGGPGAPVVIPTGYGRDGNTLYLHGSTGAQSLRSAAAGAEVCVTVTHLDGVVYARSIFHHSVNYRSAVIHGTAIPITEPQAKLRGLRVLAEHLAPGSWDYTRPPNARELAATAVLTLDLTEASVKIRSGGPVEEDEDVEADKVWAGHLPLRQVWGEPQGCTLMSAGHPVPSHIAARAAAPFGAPAPAPR
jgi:nitroimidazol reductase NimA-like FMN-containing flavoprotein (pyridoxamine 5'-phosphate oxidase superfamily)